MLIDASGPIADPSVPDLPGLDTFTGAVFHSARWNHDVDLAGRNVVVVGTGVGLGAAAGLADLAGDRFGGLGVQVGEVHLGSAAVSRLAVAAPIPDPAPAMTAILPVSSVFLVMIWCLSRALPRAGAAAGVWWLARFRVRRRVVGQAPVRPGCGDVVSVASSAAALASWSSACRLALRGSQSPAMRKMSGMNRTWPPAAIQK